MDFTAADSSDWGSAVRDASDLVKQISRCECLYAIDFGVGAQNLHLHLIPRHLNEPGSKAWAVADSYQDMYRGVRAAADFYCCGSDVATLSIVDQRPGLKRLRVLAPLATCLRLPKGQPRCLRWLTVFGDALKQFSL